MLLPMPPMPSTLTRRQRSCTIHWVSSATSTSRAAKCSHPALPPNQRAGRLQSLRKLGQRSARPVGKAGGAQEERAGQPARLHPTATFWCAAFHSARISCSSRPAAKACLLHAQGNELFEAFRLG